MLGRGIDHEVVPYFFSDLADWASLEYVGPAAGEAVIRGSLEEGEFARSSFTRTRSVVAASRSAARTTSITRVASSPSARGPDTGALADLGTDLGTL